MTAYVFALVLALASGIVFYRILSLYLELRTTANELLAVAQKQFADSVNSLLETPKDLSDETLSIIKMMGETAFMPRADRILLKKIKMIKPGRRDSREFPAVDHLRPELKNLFGKAAVAWLNIMTHKSTIGGLRISYAMSKIEVAAGEISATPTKTALPAMREMAASWPPARAA